MRPTFLLFLAVIGVFYFIGSINNAHSKSVALQRARSEQAAADLARQERDRIAEQEARERERVAQERAERDRIKTNIETVLRQDAKTVVGTQSAAEIVTRMR